MDRMLVVVFDNESKATEGSRALQQLDGDGKHRCVCSESRCQEPRWYGSCERGR